MILRVLLFGFMASGLLGFGLVVWAATRPPTGHAANAGETLVVIAAAHALQPGVLLKPEDLIAKTIKRANLPRTATADTTEARRGLAGAMVRRGLAPGDVILAQDVMRPGDHGFLAAVLAPGMRAVTVGVDLVTGTAGLIWPGDRVDVILTQSIGDHAAPPGRQVAAEAVLTNVRVIAIDQRLVEGAAPERADPQRGPHRHPRSGTERRRAAGRRDPARQAVARRPRRRSGSRRRPARGPDHVGRGRLAGTGEPGGARRARRRPRVPGRRRRQGIPILMHVSGQNRPPPPSPRPPPARGGGATCCASLTPPPLAGGGRGRGRHMAPLSSCAPAHSPSSVLLLATGRTMAEPAPTRLTLETGAGRVISLAAPVANVFVADPKVAEVRPASSTALFVFGVGPGRTTVAALDAGGHPVAELQVTVDPSGFTASQAQATLGRLLPGSRVAVAATRRGLLLTGSVSSPVDAARAAAIAHGFAAAGQEVMNELKVENTAQVTLQVRIVEMTRSLTRALGVNWNALGSIGSIAKLPALNAVLNGPSSVVCAAGSTVLPLGSAACLGANLGAAINALATDGIVHVLAEPNLTVTSGEPASFLVGGEFPIPVGQQNGEVTIQFKSYGVQLAFVPTVLDDGRINLKVSPEVSQLSQQGAVQLTAGNSTISVPALTVRRAETTVELGSGQSFAIAGLLQDSSDRTGSGLPGLRHLPILGQLFRSDSYQRDETELVILVTPILARPVDDPAALRVPTAEDVPAPG